MPDCLFYRFNTTRYPRSKGRRVREHSPLLRFIWMFCERGGLRGQKVFAIRLTEMRILLTIWLAILEFYWEVFEMRGFWNFYWGLEEKTYCSLFGKWSLIKCLLID